MHLSLKKKMLHARIRFSNNNSRRVRDFGVNTNFSQIMKWYGHSRYYGGICMPTKSHQQVVTAISTKVTQLIISSFNDDHVTNRITSSGQLVSCAEKTLSSLEEFAKATKKVVKKEFSNEVGVAREVDNATQSLLLAGGNLLLCCQIQATKTNSEDSYLPTNLNSCVQKVFQGLVVLLLCIDSASVQKLVLLCEDTKDSLANLTTSNSTEALIEKYKDLAGFIQRLYQSVNERSSQLVSTKHKDSLKKSLAALKHSMPMLATAYNMSIKYPHNEEAISSKAFASQQVGKTLSDILGVLKAGPDGSEQCGGTGIGVITHQVRCIDEMVSLKYRHSFNKLQLETAVQSLIQHIMRAIVFANETSSGLSRKSNSLLRECQKLINAVCSVTKLLPNREAPPDVSSSADDNSEFASVCRSVRSKVKSLHLSTQELLAALIADVYTVTSEPFNEMLLDYQKMKKKGKDNTREFVKSQQTFEKITANQIECAHVAGMCCETSSTLKELHSCILTLENVYDQLDGLKNTHSIHDVDDSFITDNGKTLNEIGAEWKSGVQTLILLGAFCVGRDRILNQIEADIVNDFEQCQKELVNLDDFQLSKYLTYATGRAKLLAILVGEDVSNHADPLFRNGVLAHVRQLHELINVSVASGNQLMDDMSRLHLQEGFLAAASALKSQVSNVIVALHSKVNHPELTSDQRKGLRDFSDRDVVAGMIKEMHVLNQKLSVLGFGPKISAGAFDFNRASKVSGKVTKNSDMHQDELLGTSGSSINLDDSDPKQDASLDYVAFRKELHPFVQQYLNDCLHNGTDENDNTSFLQVRQATEFLNELVEESGESLRCCEVGVKEVDKTPYFYKEYVDSEDESATHLADATIDWLKSHNETFSVMCERRNAGNDANTIRSLCTSWSETFNLIVGCCLRALWPFTICVRKFLAFSYPLNAEIRRTTEDGDDRQPNLIPSKSQDVLSILERRCETYVILIRDIVMITRLDNSRRKRQISGEGNSRQAMVKVLNRILEQSKMLSSNIGEDRRSLREKKRKMMETHKPNNLDKAWLQIYAIKCSSKMSDLSLKCDEISKLVLGVRRLTFPVDCLIRPHEQGESTLQEYKRRVKTLALSILEKSKKALHSSSLNLGDFSKLSKVRDRIEVTYTGIETTLEFLIKRLATDDVTAKHGHVIDHVTFLHRRFMLEVARLTLVVKELNLVNRIGDNTLGAARLFEDPVSLTADTNSIVTAPPELRREKSFEERLADLVQNRKEREKEIFRILSDFEADTTTAESLS